MKGKSIFLKIIVVSMYLILVFSIGKDGEIVKPAEMEKLKKFIDDDTSGTKLLEPEFVEVYKTCYNWVCDKGNLEIKDGQSTFETLEDIFITKLYLEPAIKILKSAYKKVFKEDFTPDYIDRTAIISMAIDYFGSQMIPASDDDNSLRITMGRGNFLPVLIDDGMGLSIADRIYHYMIEIANRNNIKELAGWVEEYREIMGIDYEPFTAEEYELFNKGKMVAYREYGKEREKGNPYDYGYVENPEIFESKISFAKAKEELTKYLKENFSNSSFMRERNNPEIVARNYMMVRNMCNNEKFLRITEIYCRDTEVITHSRGYESKTIMLADFQRVKLAEVWDKESDTDTDGDGIADSKEAYEEEEIDISEFIKIYCDYNHLNTEERNEYMNKYSKITVHNYRSNPVLPDTDFDGRDDSRDIAMALETKRWYEGETFTLKERFTIEVEDKEYKKGILTFYDNKLYVFDCIGVELVQGGEPIYKLDLDTPRELGYNGLLPVEFDKVYIKRGIPGLSPQRVAEALILGTDPNKFKPIDLKGSPLRIVMTRVYDKRYQDDKNFFTRLKNEKIPIVKIKDDNEIVKYCEPECECSICLAHMFKNLEEVYND